MRASIAALAFAAVFAASAAQAGVTLIDPATGHEGPVNWHWIAKPDAMNMALVMTLISRHDAHTGDVGLVECVISKDRRPGDCHTIKEPPRSRMGEAAARLASFYKASTHDDAGASPVCRTVRIGFSLTSDGGFES